MILFLKISLAISLAVIGFCIGSGLGTFIYVPGELGSATRTNKIAFGTVCSVMLCIIGLLEGSRLKPIVLKKAALKSSLLGLIALICIYYVIF